MIESSPPTVNNVLASQFYEPNCVPSNSDLIPIDKSLVPEDAMQKKLTGTLKPVLYKYLKCYSAAYPKDPKHSF